MKRQASELCRNSACGVLMLVAAALTGCGGDGGSAGGPQIGVTVSAADLGTIQPGAAVQVAATVYNDSATAAVTWTVSCATAPCGTVSPTTTASGATTTYTAPATRPPADLAVSITATSVSNTAASASSRVTVAGGMAIAIAPGANTTVPGGASKQFTATVVNDPAKGGVTWSLSCSAAPCGTVAPASTANGVQTTYTAPPTPVGFDLEVTLTAASASNAAVTTSLVIIVPGLTVVIDPPGPVSVLAGTSTQFTATVNNDPPNKGVGWTVQCSASDCGTVSPSTSASGAPVTYTAPATPPPADLTVTLTASSVTAPSAQGSANITMSAVTVAVVPDSALIPLNVTQQFTGSVEYDPTNGTVAWSLMQNGVPCSTACGNVSPTVAANGAAVTYTAPAVLPANSTVTVTATSMFDHTKSADATVVLTSGNVKLVPTTLVFAKYKAAKNSTLTNTGSSSLTISGINVTGSTLFSQTNTCGSSVGPGASCSITVTHNFSKAHTTALLTISDSSSDSPQQLRLSANGSYQVTAAMRSALAGETQVVVPPPTGSNEVGTRVLHLIDPTRVDPFVFDGTKRELLVRFWYPTLADSGCVAAPYTSPQVWSYFSALVGVPLPHVSTHSCLNAPIASGLHPVVVLSHGFTGTFTDYTFLAEDLASRGYVVASVNHTHEATAVEFPDGRLEKSVFGSHLTHYVRSDAGALGLAVAVRLNDLRFVLDELRRLNAGYEGDFTARLDLSRIALAGHSLGGLTTLRALEREPRFKAGVLFDTVMPPYPARAIDQAILTLVVGRERWNEDDCQLWRALRGPRRAVNLPGAEHIALSDAVWLLRGNVSTGGASPEVAIAAIREYVATFLDSNLRDPVPGSLPGSPVPDFPGAVVATQTQSLCTEQ
jgi:predicted dienelactone hydrolase